MLKPQWKSIKMDLTCEIDWENKYYNKYQPWMSIHSFCLQVQNPTDKQTKVSVTYASIKTHPDGLSVNNQ